MSRGFVTNLELRESNTDGTKGAGLSHTAEGLFLLHVLELAAEGEPIGAVTVVHDAGEHGGRYEELAGELADAGHAVALPDMRGHGRSEGDRGHSWGMPEAVRDIDSVQAHLAYRMPDAPTALVGHGLGGLYALAYALAHPDRLSKLVLLAPWLSPSGKPPEKPSGLERLFKKPKPTDAGELGFDESQWSSDPERRTARENDPLVHRVLTRHTQDHLPNEAAEVVAGADHLTIPTLILLGSEDAIVDASEVRSLAGEHVTVEIIEGADHDLLRGEQGPNVRARIRAFL